MTRHERGRWGRLPRTPARQILGKKSSDSANNKAFDQYRSRVLLLDQMVTNFSVFNFLKALLVCRIRDLLIKSQMVLCIGVYSIPL